jgi:hypothetical protein
LTAADVVAVSTAVRELRPVHVDPDAARAAGLPDVILGTTGQQLWLWRHLTDWFGPRVRLVALDHRMQAPIPPGQLVVDGEVVAVDGSGTVELTMTMTIDGTVAATAGATVELPAPEG